MSSKNKWLYIIAISFSSIVLIVKYNPYNIRPIFRLTGSFLLNTIRGNSNKIPNYPSDISLLFNKIKLLLKLYSTKPHPHTSIAGFKVFFRDNIQINALFDEIFDLKLYYFKTKKIQPFIIDCGSNIGMSVLFFKKIYPNSQILAFEPTSSNFELLNKNIKENNLNNITTIKKALTTTNGTATFYNPGWEGGTLNLATSSNTETVKTTMLSQYINQEVDLLKIDIEGAETDVIADITKKNKLHFIKEIVLEYHHSLNTPSSNNLSKILKIFDDNKFKYIISGFFMVSPNNFYNDDKKDYQTFLIYAYNENNVKGPLSEPRNSIS